MSSPPANSPAAASNTLTYSNILGPDGCSAGTFRVGTGALAWRNPRTGDVIQLSFNEVEGLLFRRVGLKLYNLEVTSTDHYRMTFGGFRDKEKTEISNQFASTASSGKKNIQPETSNGAFIGFNWGDYEVGKNSTLFNIDGSLAFEFQSKAISNVTSSRNDINIEFDYSNLSFAHTKPGNGGSGGKPSMGDYIMDIKFQVPPMSDNKASNERAANVASELMSTDGATLSTISPVLELSYKSLTSPPGRFNLELHNDMIKLTGKSGDFRIAKANILKAYMLPENGQCRLVLVFDAPLKKGKTEYPHAIIAINESKLPSPLEFHIPNSILATARQHIPSLDGALAFKAGYGGSIDSENSNSNEPLDSNSPVWDNEDIIKTIKWIQRGGMEEDGFGFTNVDGDSNQNSEITETTAKGVIAYQLRVERQDETTTVISQRLMESLALKQMFKVLYGIEILGAGCGYVNTTGERFFSCAYKVHSGLLYPMDDMLLFGPKPLLQIPYSSITEITYAGGTRRVFDFIVEVSESSHSIGAGGSKVERNCTVDFTHGKYADSDGFLAFLAKKGVKVVKKKSAIADDDVSGGEEYSDEDEDYESDGADYESEDDSSVSE